MFALSDDAVPAPVRTILRGIGQVFFQENAWTGGCFALGIAISSPLMALGAVVGAAIGAATARVLKFDEKELTAGIYGFNSTLVGIATLFFFRPGVMSSFLLVGGCVVATLLTWLARNMFRFRRTPPRSSSQPGSCFYWVRPFRCLRLSLGGRWKERASSRPWPTE